MFFSRKVLRFERCGEGKLLVFSNPGSRGYRGYGRGRYYGGRRRTQGGNNDFLRTKVLLCHHHLTKESSQVLFGGTALAAGGAGFALCLAINCG